MCTDQAQSTPFSFGSTAVSQPAGNMQFGGMPSQQQQQQPAMFSIGAGGNATTTQRLATRAKRRTVVRR